MKLSIVDQSPVPAGATPADALRNTIDLARLADQLGYERYPGGIDLGIGPAPGSGPLEAYAPRRDRDLTHLGRRLPGTAGGNSSRFCARPSQRIIRLARSKCPRTCREAQRSG